jgi:hypothetical protein
MKYLSNSRSLCTPLVLYKKNGDEVSINFSIHIVDTDNGSNVHLKALDLIPHECTDVLFDVITCMRSRGDIERIEEFSLVADYAPPQIITNFEEQL